MILAARPLRAPVIVALLAALVAVAACDDAPTGPLDGGQDAAGDAGLDPCPGLAREACAATAGCEVRTCPGCAGETFATCAAAGSPPPLCAEPICPCEPLDQAACEAARHCHGVYEDRVDCDAGAAGACARFVRCAEGPADCLGLDLACRAPTPFCSGPYVVGHAGACYEGCVRADACAPSPVVCGPGVPRAFPAFSRRCATAADCAFEVVPLDCCRTGAATGVALEEARRLARAAAACDAQLPDCECEPEGIRTEDGRLVDGPDAVEVACVEGECRTRATR